MVKVHLDTDLGGDIDDLCALALLLRWPGIELTGITTVGDDKGRRAGYTREALRIAGRDDIPVAAGADMADGYYPYPLGLPDEARYWPRPVPPAPGPVEVALDLLKRSIDAGALVIGIGPYTNLRLLDERYPGTLARTNLWLMGGYVYPVRAGFPQWGNDMDFNVQVDVRSAQHVFEHGRPSLTPLTVTVETSLRRACLPALRASGPLGALIARQAEAFAEDWENETRLALASPGLPDDTINFQHDPLTCAIALGWRDGIEIAEVPLRFEVRNGLMHEIVDSQGRPTPVVTRIDGMRFSDFWLQALVVQQCFVDRFAVIGDNARGGKPCHTKNGLSL